MLNVQNDTSGHWFDEAPGGRLWVADYGPVEADHTIVCLHGMRDHGDSFRALVSYFPDSRVLLPDLRGHGRVTGPVAILLLNLLLTSIYQRTVIAQVN